MSDAHQRAEEIVADAHQELGRLRDVRSRTHLDLHELHARLGEVLAALPESYRERDTDPATETQ